MITSFTKNSTKWSLVGLAVILLISGCALTNAKTDVSQKGDNVIEYATQLKFAAVPTSELPAEKPEAGLKELKGTELELQISGKKVLVKLYQGTDSHDVYAFLIDEGQSYSIGLASSYSLLGINELIASDLTGNGQNELLISGDMGAAYVELKVIGYDAETKRWLNLLTMGTPKIVDLDGDGKSDLMAVSAAGSIPSYLLIYQWTQGHFEMADVVKQLGNVYTTLVEQDGSTLIQSGTDDAKKLFRYADGELAEVNTTE
ncbi:hypothetical protein [Paenibacillus sp. FSL K6-2524]|uniref:hypothetical protein n=1 Tax=Paenibacillus sp. FSL K6-2524 TaxID=2954516 RepID=UPI0030F682B1